MDLRDYIKEYKINLPEHLLETILTEYKNDLKYAETLGGTDITFRNCKGANLTERSHLNATRKDIDTLIFSELYSIYEQYTNLYKTINCIRDSGYDFLVYEAGGFYKEHTDDYATDNYRRRISSIILLNDDYEGGDLAFFNKEYIIKPKKNTVILFPSNFMYPHQILPITKGTRYSIVTWFI